jgi:hypothetical protein
MQFQGATALVVQTHLEDEDGNDVDDSSGEATIPLFEGGQAGLEEDTPLDDEEIEAIGERFKSTFDAIEDSLEWDAVNNVRILHRSLFVYEVATDSMVILYFFSRRTGRLLSQTEWPCASYDDGTAFRPGAFAVLTQRQATGSIGYFGPRDDCADFVEGLPMSRFAEAIWAARSGDVAVMLQTLDTITSDIDVADSLTGKTLLQHAAQAGQPDTVRALLDRGAAIDRTGDAENYPSPLGLVADSLTEPGHLEVMRILIAGGANITDEIIISGDSELVQEARGLLLY